LRNKEVEQKPTVVAKKKEVVTRKKAATPQATTNTQATATKANKVNPASIRTMGEKDFAKFVEMLDLGE